MLRPCFIYKDGRSVPRRGCACVVPRVNLRSSRIGDHTFCQSSLQLGLCLAFTECSALGAVEEFGQVDVDSGIKSVTPTHAFGWLTAAYTFSVAVKPRQFPDLSTTLIASASRVESGDVGVAYLLSFFLRR